MNDAEADSFSQYSLPDLFRAEVEAQTGLMTSALLEAERNRVTPQLLEVLMRAAHSLKGAARIVNLPSAVRLAHLMEDCFVAAQHRDLELGRSAVDLLLRAVDLLAGLARRTEAALPDWEAGHADEIGQVLDGLEQIRPRVRGGASAGPARGMDTAGPQGTAARALVRRPGPTEISAPGAAVRKSEPPERVLRLTAESLNRLLGLAGEFLVESRWLRPFGESLQRLKNHHNELAHQLDSLRLALDEGGFSERAKTHFHELVRELTQARQFLADRVQELELYDRRSAQLSHRLYLEVLRTRMRPFGDGVRRFPRMVRDLARSLGKEVRLEITGESTQVDRDILERLESPLAHLLRNAVDHGCQNREEREAAGKPPENTIRLDARHSAGMLLVTVSDDGAGVLPERLRRAVTDQNLADDALAQKLPEADLLEFLFLPGFTLKDSVTEISGRGVGLDVVQNMVRSVRGAIRLNNQPGRGLRVQLQLPLTLSVVRTLLFEVAGEPYAIPLSQILRILKVPRADVQALEGQHFFHLDQQPVGLLSAHQILECGEPPLATTELPVVVLGDRNSRYALLVDRFLGERELVVQPLDPRLGKLQDISAAALMEDGAPVLILDVEDLLRSIQQAINERRAAGARQALVAGPRKPKRVLAVDDSVLVRELERKLLAARGYHVDVAVDGAEAWKAVRSGQYDLVITDVDMPHVTGLELARRIRNEPRLKSLPVLVISYKEREDERRRGLEAGADYYLAKGTFDDETLVEAVRDLIGEPEQ